MKTNAVLSGMRLLVLSGLCGHAMAVEMLTSANFNPSPSGNPITTDFDVTGIATTNGVFLSIEGPTNATVVSATGRIYPSAGVDPGSLGAALTGLHMNGVYNFSTIDVFFATVVNDGAGKKFFLTEIGGNDAVTVKPLDSSGALIAGWSLTLATSAYGKQVGPTQVKWKLSAGGSTTYNFGVAGASFGLSDFTGGTPPLTGVAGLRITGSNNADLGVVGVYDATPAAAGTPLALTSATFAPPPSGSPNFTNDMTFATITAGGDTHTALSGTATAYVVEADPQYFWPIGGSNPGSKEATATGLWVRGLVNAWRVHYVMAAPVTGAKSGFFLTEHAAALDDGRIRPLDANGNPIGAWSVSVASTSWGGALTSSRMSWANVPSPGNLSDFVGVVVRLEDFKGGTGTLNEAWGISIEDADKTLDPMTVGSFTVVSPPLGTVAIIR